MDQKSIVYYRKLPFCFQVWVQWQKQNFTTFMTSLWVSIFITKIMWFLTRAAETSHLSSSLLSHPPPPPIQKKIFKWLIFNFLIPYVIRFLWCRCCHRRRMSLHVYLTKYNKVTLFGTSKTVIYLLKTSKKKKIQGQTEELSHWELFFLLNIPFFGKLATCGFYCKCILLVVLWVLCN